MTPLRFFSGIGFLILTATARLIAQDAQQILDSAAKVYAGATSYSAEVDTRTVYLRFPAKENTSEAPAHFVSSVQYRRLQIKVRRPYDYLLGSQIYSEGPQGEQRGSGSDAAAWAYLSRTESSSPQQGLIINGVFSIKSVPAEQFTALLNSRLGARAADDVVLKYFHSQALESAEAPTMGLTEPDLIGRETRNGREMYRLVAKTRARRSIMLWIDRENFQVVRTITQRTSMPMGGSGRPAGMPNTPSPFVSVVETLYGNQKINPPLALADFAISSVTKGAGAERKTAEQIGFSSVDELVKQADVAPDKSNGAGDGGEGGESELGEAGRPGETPVPGAEGAKPAAETPAAGQALSYEQMSGIVLIDGDGGTASGFMTKIRDVDFVVTNLHVLVGNKKITIKTLSGEEIAPMGIFGAVGGDIAIIRIGKGQGDLKLATDVFKTSKIGDKVVVVGNRRGGGVATQTAGTIKGVGPKLVEVDANFQPGNSGSPIVNLANNEVIGVATYSSTRRVDVDSGSGGSSSGSRRSASTKEPEVEKRWFGYRLDGVSKWEAVDLTKWNDQAERLTKFRENSEALHAVIRFEFKDARQNPRLTSILDNFESKYRATGGSGVSAASEVKDLFRVIRTISEDGVRDLTTGDFYDYYRTCQYWENSIPAQLEYRKAIIEVLKRYENNSSGYLSRMRGGN